MSPPRAPYPLGPFDLISPAAEGASGVIWRAIHRSRRVPVAVKIITPSPTADRERMQRLFAHEVRSVAGLDHPGVVRIHDFGTLPASNDPRLPGYAPYLAMEWIGGGTLARHAGAIGWSDLRATLLSLLDALAHAHARGVIHQDIKSANVLMSDRGAVLSDFGIAFSFEHAIALDSGPHFMGTPDYMAPEQILMQRRVIGPWTDLYALGCLAYELVTGRPPFAERSRFEVLRAHLDARIPEMGVRDDIPLAFAGWVHRLLDKDPTRRHRYAADAAAALRALPGPALPAARSGASLSTLPLPGTGRALFSLRETEVAGRVAERTRLLGLLDGVVETRRARLALLEGPSGVGKSRLAIWLARAAHAAGRADAMRAHHGLENGGAGDLGDGLSAMFARYLRATGLEGEDLVELLTERLGDEDAAWGAAAALSPDRRFALDDRAVMLGSTGELDDALCQILARLTLDRPLLVLIDDGQWAESGLRLAERLLTHHPGLPVLMIVAISTDRLSAAIRARLDGLLAHDATERIAVGPLSAEALTASLRARLRLEDGALQDLVRRAGGSPVFAEELIRHWLRTDALVERPDGSLGLRPGAGEHLPDDLVSMWDARLHAELDPLGALARRGLEAAAVAGNTVIRRIWRAVAGLDSMTLDAAREHLLDAGLAVPDPSGGWRFAHPMLREVLIASAREAGRLAELHRRAALALMEHGADPGLIADHHLAAGAPAEAVPLLFDAARRRRQLRDQRGMRRDLLRLARALDALRRPFDAPERIELRILWGEACQTGDDPRAAWRHVARAARQARERGDQRLIGWSLLTQAHLRVREQDAVERRLRAAWAAASRARDAELSWNTAHALTFVMIKTGRFDDAEAGLGLLRGLIDARPGHADDIRRGDMLRLEALIARGRGHFERARESALGAAALYRRSGSRLKQAHGHNLIGDLARYSGRLDEAADAYRSAVRYAELAGSYDGLTDELNLGLVLLELERYPEARQRLTAVVQRAERIHFKVMLIYAHLCLIVCEARDRRWAAWDARWRIIAPVRAGKMVDVDVCRIAERAAGLAAAAGDRTRAAAALRLAADQYRRLGRADDAADAEARAAALERP